VQTKYFFYKFADATARQRLPAWTGKSIRALFAFEFNTIVLVKYRLKREAAAVYPPAAKPDDYQYGEMKPSNNEAEYGSQQPQQQPQPAYGAEGGKQNYESPSNAYGSKPTPSYGNSHSSYNYNYPQKPKVCCKRLL